MDSYNYYCAARVHVIAGGSDFTPIAEARELIDGVPQCVAIILTDNVIPEPSEIFFVDLNLASATLASLTVTIIDDDGRYTLCSHMTCTPLPRASALQVGCQAASCKVYVNYTPHNRKMHTL
jgi:hypothetical protein